jgi:cysteine desulfuration protein SufE
MNAPADPASQESALASHWRFIPDAHERLALATRAATGPGLPDFLKSDAALVPGCISRVWLHANSINGTLCLSWDADSAIVRGLAGLVCAVYQNTPTAAAAAHHSSILAALGFDRMISPTRLNGMAALASRIRELAAALP